jgi:hypothetical protein
MKQKGIVMVLISTLSLLLAPEAFAQGGMKWKGSGGWGMGSTYSRMYDTKTVETVSGEVVSVDTMVPMKGMSNGVHLNLKTGKGTISVHLGPAWFIEKQDITIEPKDRVEVKGSRITLEGKPALIAAEVKKGGEVLMLRDEKGFPFWSGWQRR